MRTTLISFLFLCTCSTLPTPPSTQQPSSPVSTTIPALVPTLDWHDPDVACKLFADEGIPPNLAADGNVHYFKSLGNEKFCTSDRETKLIGKDDIEHSSISYQAIGTEQRMDLLILDLKFYPQREAEGRAELNRLVILLQNKLGLKPITEVSDAILQGKKGKWEGEDEIAIEIRNTRYMLDPVTPAKFASVCVKVYDKNGEKLAAGYCW